MKPKVLVTRLLPSRVMELLHTHFQVSVNERDRPLPRQELLGMAAGVDGLLPLLTDRIDAELMDAAGAGLKAVANYAVGFNNIDLKAATQRKIAVCNTPGVLTDTTADLAMGLLLASARRLAEADAYVRQGQFKSWGPLLFLGSDVHGKTLGIMGMGRIGQAMARRARGFDMKVVYYSRTPLDGKAEQGLGVEYREKKGLLAESDFVSLHLPLTPQTRRFLSDGELAAMKPGAFLINTSRGEVVDEAALVRALENGVIAGAGLDVYENEPELHPGLAGLPNVTLAPHIGSATRQTRTRMGLMAAENLVALLVKGQTPPNCLNPQVLE